MRYPCPGCSADLEFDPKAGQLKCPYCGSEVSVPQENTAREIRENDLQLYLTPDASRLARLAENAVEVACESCGAVTEFTPPEVAGFCPFCAAKIVAQPIAAHPLIAPEAVLPFAVPKKDAQVAIKRWLGSRWFAPSALKNMARQDGIAGVYLPHWTYDSQTQSRYRGERGEHYYETERYSETDQNGRIVWKERQVQKTRWYPASGTVARFFDDLLIPASRAVNPSRVQDLSPWDLQALVPYEPAYLAGFRAQRYQVDLGTGFESAKEIMSGVIHSDVRSDIGGDEQRVHSIQTDYSAETFKHILLPIWIAAYRFEGKVFQVLINARTGEVQGERPYSIWKIAGVVLLVIAAIALYYWWQNGQQKPQV
ncbi:TFIIB-type zinc ribbon-containing protein [Armatimonas sp.]|uniref:TFIIB-type zinc ribbon-containing protein n=1 Tax=Armatimonas sp. TaxID=1872638 RepID=UPI00286B5972|nr:TFIIB-type zinc ribbon-containing protein [Armatimonas sp.]